MEVFDSLGVSESFIKDNIPRIATSAFGNSTPVQPEDSKHCGEYCLFFILHRLMNIDLKFEELLNAVFCQDLKENERRVLEFIEYELISE